MNESNRDVKISIITATWNCEATVGDCLASVAAQRWPHREHIVMDGASRDDTLALLAKRRTQLAVLVSEPDDGIYDALNKGIALASGDVIGFLHADDVFADDTALSRVAAAFADPSVEAVYGDLQYVARDDLARVIRHWASVPFTPRRLRRGWMPPHPTLYVRRAVYDRLGVFDTRYRIAADYDFMLRLFAQPGLQAVHIPAVLVKMRVGGVSNRSFAHIVQKSREDLRALRENRIGGLWALVWKNVGKLGQFWVR